MEAGSNAFCQICNRGDPDWYCKCQNSLTLLCQTCFGLHLAKTSKATHENGPISSLRYRRDEHRDIIEQRIAEFRQNIQLIETCIVDVSNRIDAILDDLREFKLDFCRKAEQQKRKLEEDLAAAVQEVRSDVESAALRSSLARVMRCNQPGKLTAFTYSIAIEDALEKVRTGIKTLVLPYSILEAPVAVLPNRYAEFDIHMTTWKPAIPLQRLITVDCYSSVVTVDNGRLFVCGGGNPNNEGTIYSTAFLIDKETVTDLPYLPQGRTLAGAIFNPEKSSVYVFGGHDRGIFYAENELRTGLSFSLALHTSWTSLPDMHNARSGFNPCWGDDVVYLPGGCTRVEAFHPLTGSMTLLGLQLPDSFSEYYCVSVLNGEELVLVANQVLVRANVKRQQLTVETLPKAKVVEWSQSRPICRKGKIYFVDLLWSPQCVCVQYNSPMSITSSPLPNL